MSKHTLIEHPILQHKLCHLLDQNISTIELREVIKETASLLTYEACANLALKNTPITSCTGTLTAQTLKDPVTVVPIWRAGSAMLDGFLHVIPHAKIGHMGLFRNSFIEDTVEYYFNVPNDTIGKHAFVLEPLIGSGGTVLAACERLLEFGVSDITVLNIVCSQPGLNLIHKDLPEVKIFTLSIARELNDEGLLVPGLGDLSQRLYGGQKAKQQAPG